MPDRSYNSLVSILSPSKIVVIQTHDRPDIDAVSSAYALSALLRLSGIANICIVKGPVKSKSLENLCAYLGASVCDNAEVPGNECDIVVVDALPENGNVSLVPGTLKAAIDHHESSGRTRATYVDIRPEVGSCCSIIASYWAEAGCKPDTLIATALLAGIYADTDFLAREVGRLDIEAFAMLAEDADMEKAANMVKIALDSSDLSGIADALANAVTEGDKLFAVIEEPCRLEAPAILADLALRASDIRIAVIAIVDKAGYRISARSRDRDAPAWQLVKQALDGIGSSGGHFRGAGGYVPQGSFPGNAQLKELFFEAVDTIRKQTRSEDV
jgi:nanoRNase/pAp phosphatase (c-di-AMP/oligoRNAs hydrolase)